MVNIMKERRKALGLSQAELGEAVGRAQRTIAAYESGDRRPSPEEAKIIGEKLGFHWTKFFEDEDSKEANNDGN